MYTVQGVPCPITFALIDVFNLYKLIGNLFKSLFWKCNLYMTPHAVSLLVCLSVIISLKGGKLHCNAPIGAVVTYHEHFYEQSFPNPHSHLRTSPLHLQHSPTSSFIKSNLFLFSIALGLCIYCNLSIHTRTHLINFARELCPQTIPRKAPLQSRAERRRSPLCLDRLVHSSHWLLHTT